MSLLSLLFSFSGPIDRRKFWIGLAIIAVIGAALGWLAEAVGGRYDPYWYTLRLSGLLIIYMVLALGAKRSLDRGHPRWVAAFVLIPWVGPLWYLIDLGFLPSQAPPSGLASALSSNWLFRYFGFDGGREQKPQTALKPTSPQSLVAASQEFRLPAPPIGDDWRLWLIKSLQLANVKAPQVGTAARWVLGLIVFLGLPALTGVLKAGAKSSNDNIVVLAFAGLFLLVIPFAILFRRMHNRTQTPSALELLNTDARRPVLYLRPFGLDDRLERPFALQTPEELLTSQLFRIGPVIAIGRPGEPLPALGAARFYATDKNWQQKIADVASVSQLVVWATGFGEGVRWELKHLLAHIPKERLIIVAHPHLTRGGEVARQADWARFVDTVGREYPTAFPRVLGETRFMTFAPSGQPQFFSPKIGKKWFGMSRNNAMMRTLDDVLSSKGFFDRKLLDQRDSRKSRSGWLFVLCLVVAPIMIVASPRSAGFALIPVLLAFGFFFRWAVLHRAKVERKRA